MADAPRRGTRDHSTLAAEVDAAARRKLDARRDGPPIVWSGLGVMGAIGWSIAIPTLLGVAAGIWLDARHPGTHSWTLALLVGGLILGCFAAWHWIAGEERAMRDAKSRDEARNEGPA